ncbi:MAG: hypothetical protein JWQ78_1408 [Sediminibacterium sp.]|nr:hypothetical protein [Sediminibacterium sp.]
MKKFLLILVFCTVTIACFFAAIVHKIRRQHSQDISISVKESENMYKLYASYNKNKTRKIQRYLDAQLNSDMFSNARIDANVVLEDHTNFYIKANPGVLMIRLNKRDNSIDSYYRIKHLGEGIKKRLAEN